MNDDPNLNPATENPPPPPHDGISPAPRPARQGDGEFLLRFDLEGWKMVRWAANRANPDMGSLKVVKFLEYCVQCGIADVIRRQNEAHIEPPQNICEAVARGEIGVTCVGRR